MSKIELVNALKAAGITGISKLNKEELEAKHNEYLASQKEVKSTSTIANLEAEVAKIMNKGGVPMNVTKKYNPSEALQNAIRESIEKEGEALATMDDLLDDTVQAVTPRWTLLTGEEINGSEQVNLPGQIAKLYSQDDSYILRYEDGVVPIGINTTLRYKAALSGKFQLIRIQYQDINLRITCMKMVMDSLKGLEAKYNQPKYAIFWHSDSKDMKGLVGFKEDFDELFGVDIFTSGKDPVKLIGYDTPSNVSITGSTKPELNFLMLNIVGPNGEAYNDGQAYFNMLIKYKQYQSTKDKEAGKKESWKRENTFQFRAFSPLFMKGQAACAWQYIHDICLSYGIPNWENYDGVINMDVAKTNPQGIKHGDSFKVKAADIKMVNRITDDPFSSAGVQMVTHVPKLVCQLADELNVVGQAQLFRGVLDGDLNSVLSMLAAPKVKSMDDADIIAPMLLGMAVPRNGIYKPLAIDSIADRMYARAVKFYQSDMLKMEASQLAAYAVACPILIPDSNGDLRDALSVFERRDHCNFIVLPDDKKFIKRWMQKKHHNSLRHPVVGIGSVQEDFNLPEKYVQELHSMGFKSIYMKEVDGVKYAVHPVTHGIIISYDRAKAQNGDFDGDMQYFVPSDNVSFGFVRMPDVVESDDEGGNKLDTGNHDLYYKYLKYKYIQTINSQPLIGMVDLLVRRIIEENRLWGHGLTKDQYMQLSDIREKMIQGRKHLSDDIDIDNPPTMEYTYNTIAKKLVKRYHCKGEMDSKADAAPATHKLKVFGATGTGIRTGSAYKAVQTILGLIPQAQLQPNYNDDPYSKGWSLIKGASIEYHNEDAAYWANKFTALWARIQGGDPTVLGLTVTSERIIAVKSFTTWINWGAKSYSTQDFTNIDPLLHNVLFDTMVAKDGDRLYRFRGYSSAAGKAAGIKDEGTRRHTFFALNRWVDGHIAGFIEGNVGFDEHRVDLLKKLMVVYFGVIGFGGKSGRGTYTKENGSIGGHSGACYWRMKSKYILWVAKIVHPDNEMIDRLIVDHNIKF
jgi:hypothetical protein